MKKRLKHKVTFFSVHKMLQLKENDMQEESTVCQGIKKVLTLNCQNLKEKKATNWNLTLL